MGPGRHAAPRPPFSDDALGRFEGVLDHPTESFDGDVATLKSASYLNVGDYWGYSTLRPEYAGSVTITDTADNILQFVSDIQANSAVIYGGDTSVANLASLATWVVTDNPTDNSAGNNSILETLDASYQSAPVEAGPITIEEARGPDNT